MENITIALDVDGTIINKKGKVDEKIMPLFNKADLEHTSFVFLTGNAPSYVSKTLDLINKNLNNPTGDKIKAYYASYCGSIIFAPSGELLSNNFFTIDQAYSLIQNIHKEDNCAAVIYATKDGYYLENQKHIKKVSIFRYLKNELILHLYRKFEKKKGDLAVSINECAYINSKEQVEKFVKDNGNISCLFVAAIKEKRKPQVVDSVKSIAKVRSLFNGLVMQLPVESKLNALKTILELEKDNPKYANRIEEVVYFGDEGNDTDMFSSCNLSVARGQKVKKKYAKFATMKIDDCTTFAEKLYSGEYDEIIKKEKSSEIR